MITYILIGITVVVSVLAFNNQKLLSDFMFNPYVIHQRNQYQRFITAGFIHGDFFHLFFNMYALFLFGTIVEQAFEILFPGYGNLLYIALYFSGLIMSSTFSYYKHKNNPRYNALGASGAVAAVMFACIIIYPSQKLMIMPIPFFIPSYIVGPLYLIYSYYMSKKGMDNIGHDAHFFGAIWGVIFVVLLWKEAIPNFIAQVF
ncbi:MAG: rhomboid family intramembrane serine protease [Chitinophagales bacterium]|nr:rhomboid family intramembrane serine protease [Chitinophagales bacterium]